MRDRGLRYGVAAVLLATSACVHMRVQVGGESESQVAPTLIGCSGYITPAFDWTASDRVSIRLRVQADGTDFGAIRDVIFDQNDIAVALVVVPAAGAGAPSGPIAFPYNPTYFERQTATYASPYPRETLNTLRPFDYDAVR